MGSPVRERHGHAGACPAKGHQDGAGTGASLLGSKSLRAGTGEGGVQGDLTNRYK